MVTVEQLKELKRERPDSVLVYRQRRTPTSTFDLAPRGGKKRVYKAIVAYCYKKGQFVLEKSKIDHPKIGEVVEDEDVIRFLKQELIKDELKA